MKRPWNIIDLPVFSLAVYGKSNFNMNICTYVTGVSRKPKLYLIAIKENSKTLEMLKNAEFTVLQLLTKKQMNLVKVLGKKSGFNFDKQKYLLENGYLTKWKNYEVLANCAAYLKLKKIDYLKTGDHIAYVFQCTASKTISETNILMFQDLVNQKIIL